MRCIHHDIIVGEDHRGIHVLIPGGTRIRILILIRLCSILQHQEGEGPPNWAVLVVVVIIHQGLLLVMTTRMYLVVSSTVRMRLIIPGVLTGRARHHNHRHLHIKNGLTAMTSIIIILHWEYHQLAPSLTPILITPRLLPRRRRGVIIHLLSSALCMHSLIDARRFRRLYDRLFIRFFFFIFFFRSGGLGAARRFTFPMLPMIFLSRQVDRNPVPYVFHGFPLALVV